MEENNKQTVMKYPFNQTHGVDVIAEQMAGASQNCGRFAVMNGKVECKSFATLQEARDYIANLPHSDVTHLSIKEVMAVTYTLSDCGCYVDGARGIYTPDYIYSFAWTHGFKPAFGEAFGGKRKLSDYEFSNEIEDEIDDFMNAQFPVEGAYWGRNENGDWGLWAIDDES